VCAYENTPNKAVIRRCWDLPILERWYTKNGKLLSYFGLPGPEIHDLLDWQHLLGVRTGIESLGHTKKEREQASETIGRLNANIMLNGLSSGFQLLRADVEDVILNSVDNDGYPPQLNDGGPAHLAHFTYDIVNLDFDGGLGYRAKQASAKQMHGAAKRVDAIKELFKRQEGHSFILFLTINVRDTLGEEVEKYLHGLQSRDRGEGWHEMLDWYLHRTKGEREYKLKAIVPSFIHSVAETRLFRCTSRPPIAYIGHARAHMIHFAFDLETATSNSLGIRLREFSLQDDRELLELPLLRSENGQLELASMELPGVNFVSFEKTLNFLPEEIRSHILAPLHSRTIMEAQR
jgi:hypothetical protein